MFSKMLVATDLSEASDRAICALGNLKNLGTREAVLVSKSGGGAVAPTCGCGPGGCCGRR